MILDIILVALAVILLPLAFMALVFMIAFVVGVIKAISPKQKRKRQEEFFRECREILDKKESKKTQSNITKIY